MSQNNELVEEEENTEVGGCFRLQTGGLIDTNYLQAVELPKFSMMLFNNKQQKLNERSPITLTFSGVEACAQLCSASQKVFKEFQIEFLDEEMNVKSTWEFIDAHIKAVDFGSVSKEMGISEPVVLCEINFKNLKIGNTII